MSGNPSIPVWWRWVVMAASFCSLFLGTSVSYSTGVYHVALLDYYQQDVVTTAWLGSLFCSMFALSGPVSSLVINMFNSRICIMTGSCLFLIGFSSSCFISDMRWLFLAYSFLPGLGEGMVYVGVHVALKFYFPGKLSLVTGIAVAGVAMGVFVYPPLTQFLLDYYGLKGCFLLTGAVCFQTAVFGAMIRPSSSETDITSEKSAEDSILRRIKETVTCDTEHVKGLLKPSFFLWLMSCYFHGSGQYITYVFLPSYYIKDGLSPQEASFLLSVIGIVGTLSRLLAGLAASNKHIGSMSIFVGTLGLVGLLDFFIKPLTSAFVGKMAYAVLFGLLASAVWPLLSSITLQLVGSRNFTTAFGIVMFACGLGILTGPPMAGYLVQIYGRHQEAFYLAGAEYCMSSACGVFLSLLMKRQKGETWEVKVESEKAKAVDLLKVKVNPVEVKLDKGREPIDPVEVKVESEKAKTVDLLTVKVNPIEVKLDKGREPIDPVDVKVESEKAKAVDLLKVKVHPVEVKAR